MYYIYFFLLPEEKYTIIPIINIIITTIIIIKYKLVDLLLLFDELFDELFDDLFDELPDNKFLIDRLFAESFVFLEDADAANWGPHVFFNAGLIAAEPPAVTFAIFTTFVHIVSLHT